MTKTNDSNSLANKICIRLTDLIINNQLSNTDLVQIIEHAGGYLNLQTRSDYAKSNGLSYNGAKNHRENVILFNQVFIIDNL